MRLHQLEISGFLAYGGQETIDFDQLSEAGFFLIHGQTGAGKTSLLDAIAFAIFGSLPGARKDVKSLRSDHAAVDTETFVVLDATVGERRLRIRRRPKYELDKGEGKAKTVDASLTVEYRTGDVWLPLDATKQGAGTEISRWIGLKADQFFRMALIPQGAFADFMRATSKQREAVLKELFAVDQKAFQEIEEYFDRQLKLASSARTDAETKLGNERSRIAQVLVASGVTTEQITGTAWIDERIAAANALTVAATAERDTGKKALDAAAEAEKAAAALIKASEQYRAAAAKERDAATTLAAIRAAAADIVSAEITTDAAEVELERIQQEASVTLQSMVLRNSRIHELEELREVAQSAQREVTSNDEAMRRLNDEIAEAAPELQRLTDAAAAGLALASDLESATAAHSEASTLLKLAAARDLAVAELPALQAAIVEADAAANLAEQVLAEAEQLQRAQFAVVLAGSLVAGEPCIVCGSLDHPTPMQPDAQWHASADAIDDARADRDAKVLIRANAHTALGTAQNRVIDREEALGANAELSASEAEARLAAATSALTTIRAGVKAAQDSQALRQALELEQNGRIARRDESAVAGPALQAAATTAAHTLSDLERDLRVVPGAEAAVEDESPLRERLDRIGKCRTELREAVDRCTAASAALAAVGAGGDLELPDLPSLQSHREQLERAYEDAVKLASREADTARSLADRRGQFAAAFVAVELASSHFESVAALANPLSGKGRSKTKLTQFYLAARLQQVLESANSRLYRMTDGRFLFKHDEGAQGKGYQSLEIAVHDSWNGAQREVNSLSGGETFTASLALALGLSDIVQAEAGGTALDSLFIDEGFGTLSPDFLGRVVEDLDRLRAGGRLVGIISHVEDLKQRIPVQLEVLKGATGSTVRPVLEDEH